MQSFKGGFSYADSRLHFVFPLCRSGGAAEDE
jgi:hypothetical protein